MDGMNGICPTRGKEDGEERQNIGKRWELSNYCVRMDRRRKRSASEYSEVVTGIIAIQMELRSNGF